jgi:SAM-dependent methyltransferase
MADHPAIDPEAFKQFERAGYSRVAAGDEQATAPVTSQVNDAILDAVGTAPGTRLLAVACGPGWLSAAAIQRGASVTGVDLAEPMVALAQSRCPTATIRPGDAEHLPYEAGQFDAVVCSLGLLHFPNPEQAIAEAWRVLTPGGRYAFTCWTTPARNPFMGLLLGAVQTHGTMDLPLPPGPPLFRFGDPTECARVLRAGGFVVVSVTELPMVWPFATPEEVAGGGRQYCMPRTDAGDAKRRTTAQYRARHYRGGEGVCYGGADSHSRAGCVGGGPQTISLRGGRLMASSKKASRDPGQAERQACRRGVRLLKTCFYTLRMTVMHT